MASKLLMGIVFILYVGLSIEKKHMSHKELVNSVKNGSIASENVWQAIENVDRINFLNVEFMTDRFASDPIHVGYGYYAESLHLVAVLLSILEPHLNETETNILEVGSGSGYFTACLQELLHKTGKIVSLELNLKMLNKTIKNSKTFYKSRSFDLVNNPTNRVKFMWWNGRRGYYRGAPYNAIYYSGIIGDQDFNKVMLQIKPCGILLGYDWVIDQSGIKTLWLKKWEKISDFDIIEFNILKCHHFYRELMKNKALLKLNDILGGKMEAIQFDRYGRIHTRSDEFIDDEKAALKNVAQQQKETNKIIYYNNADDYDREHLGQKFYKRKKSHPLLKRKIWCEHHTTFPTNL